MKLSFDRVAHRVWVNRGGKSHLAQTKQSRKLFTLMGKEMARGRAIEFTQHPPIDGGTDAAGKKIPHESGVYDQISLTITD